jgi:UDP-glucuronate decarboxylase
MALMASDDAVTGPVNIGNPEEFTIGGLAEQVIFITGSTSTVIHENLPRDDPRQRRPDISLAKSLLGWEPKIRLDEGLKKTIDYFRGVV